MMPSTPIIVDDLDQAIDHYEKELGCRLEMIKPADAPREALLRKGDDRIRLVAKALSPGFSWPDGRPRPPKGGNLSGWVTGRAGMQYRDLIDDRLGGKVIASHIRLTEGGEVADYVHYHKIDLQIIYCLKGRIKVVYEDQGPPFWLEAGDCLLQPPEIRHRVLECEAGSEVIEVTSPAEHETWAEHEINLPTIDFMPDRDFAGQRFSRQSVDGIGDLGIAAATGGRFDAGISSDVAGRRRLWVKLSDDETLSIDL